MLRRSQVGSTPKLNGQAGKDQAAQNELQMQLLNIQIEEQLAEQDAARHERSFWLLGVQNPIRKFCMDVVTNPW